MSDEQTELKESKAVEAEVIDMVMTQAVRVELHKALDAVCDELRDLGKLGSTTTFELVPHGGVQGRGDSLAVTLQLMLLPMYDGKPCGYFAPNRTMEMEVH